MPIRSYRDAWQVQEPDLSFALGIADLPHQQKQEQVILNLAQGHIALFGGSGMGKTTFLQSTILDLVRHYSPSDLEIYLMDFGTNSLAPYRGFPHVADIFTLDETEKITKLIKRLQKIHSNRKRLLSQAGVATLELYQQLTKQTLPHILIVLDNFEAIKDEVFEDNLFKLLVMLAREGIALGIHLLLTAGRQLNMRIALHSNIKTQFTLKQNDAGDVTSIVGQTPYRNMEDIRGRALLAREGVDPVQLYFPFDSDNPIELIGELRKEAKEMSDYWTGELPIAIPMAPAVLTEDDLQSRSGYREAFSQGEVILGLDKESVTLQTWHRKHSNLLMLTMQQVQMAEFIYYVLHHVQLESEKTFIFTPDVHLVEHSDDYDILSEQSEVEEMLEAMAFRIGEKIRAKDYEFETFIVFYDYVAFVNSLSAKAVEHLTTILDKGRLVGYTCLILSDGTLTGRIDSASKIVKQTNMVVLDMRVIDQNVIMPMNRNSKEPTLDFQEQWLIKDKVAHKIQVTYKGEMNG